MEMNFGPTNFRDQECMIVPSIPDRREFYAYFNVMPPTGRCKNNGLK